MLKINIEKLTFDCIIGILDSERLTPQRVIVDISFDYHFNDTTKEFIDYSLVAQLIESTMKDQQFLLIEDAILYIRKLLKERFKINNLWLKITKPDILPNCIVSVEE